MKQTTMNNHDHYEWAIQTVEGKQVDKMCNKGLLIFRHFDEELFNIMSFSDYSWNLMNRLSLEVCAVTAVLAACHTGRDCLDHGRCETVWCHFWGSSDGAMNDKQALAIAHFINQKAKRRRFVSPDKRQHEKTILRGELCHVFCAIKCFRVVDV